jgi:hypothetical protein
MKGREQQRTRIVDPGVDVEDDGDSGIRHPCNLAPAARPRFDGRTIGVRVGRCPDHHWLPVHPAGARTLPRMPPADLAPR